MKIAFVDDEQEYLDEMSLLCGSFGEETGYPVETFPFGSGESFLEAFDNSFDLIFMDVYMEGMDGVAAALEIRRQDNRCLLVLLTSSKDFMPDAFSCHAFEYITKPFSRERIFDVLSDAVKVLPQFLILLPGAASCYLPAKNRMKYSPAKTAALFMAAILPFSIAVDLRHDFHHSVRLLASLAEKGDIDSIRAHLAEYETSLKENAPADYCTNAAVNSLFGYYREMAAFEGIRTDWHIELPEAAPFFRT